MLIVGGLTIYNTPSNNTCCRGTIILMLLSWKLEAAKLIKRDWSRIKTIIKYQLTGRRELITTRQHNLRRGKLTSFIAADGRVVLFYARFIIQFFCLLTALIYLNVFHVKWKILWKRFWLRYCKDQLLMVPVTCFQKKLHVFPVDFTTCGLYKI